MPTLYKLPKISADSALHLDTPVAGDTVLADGVLTVKDEAGDVALVVKISDITSFSYAAGTAGTANVVNVVLTSTPLAAGASYSLTISAPYVQNFFGGGQETGAVYQARTYTISFPLGTGVLPPTVDQIGAAFAARIAADPGAYFTATYTAGTDTLAITAASALAGPLKIETSFTLAAGAITDATAWVSPVGTIDEVSGYINSTLLGSASYSRFIIRHRKFIRHNAVTGNEVVKPSLALVYVDATEAAAITLLTNILNGAYTPVADYLGAPQI
jgi:hypothetical protein